MYYQPRHALARAVHKVSWRARAGVAAGAVLALAGSGLAMAFPAQAATYGLSFSAVGAGNTAGWTTPAETTVSLHVENISTAANAVATVTGITPGSSAPVTAPTYTNTTRYASGSDDPRLEIQAVNLADGFNTDVTGHDPSLCGETAPNLCWGVPAPQGNGVNSYTSTWAQAQAYLTANGGVQKAYLVQDAASVMVNKPYTAVITTFSWDGQTLIPGTPPPTPVTVGPGEVSSFTDYGASCLDNSGYTWKAFNPLQLWTCGAAGGVDQQFELTQNNGVEVLEVMAPAGKPQGPWCVTALGGVQRLVIGVCKGAASQVVAKQGSYYKFVTGGLVMDDWGWKVKNGSPVGTYAQISGARNQHWGLP